MRRMRSRCILCAVGLLALCALLASCGGGSPRAVSVYNSTRTSVSPSMTDPRPENVSSYEPKSYVMFDPP